MEQAAKEPHTISLKVLRLSRPQLATQDPLPEDPTIALSQQAALALPSASIDDAFTLTTLLTLPTTFGTAYVGESFSCTLSLNNELPLNSDKRILSVKLTADMQTPSQKRPLDFIPSLDALGKHGIEIGASTQSTLTFDLREEGMHVLCININYTESMLQQSTSGPENESGGQAAIATGGRVRSLRKLYNFNVGPCLSVRTKATSLPAVDTLDTSSPLEKFLLECQLENLAHDTITIERLVFEARAPFSSKSLNWDAEHVVVPILAPREVTQVAFWISEDNSVTDEKEITKDGRTVLGVLTIHWRSGMGCLGVLSTGWLSSRPRRG